MSTDKLNQFLDEISSLDPCTLHFRDETSVIRTKNYARSEFQLPNTKRREKPYRRNMEVRAGYSEVRACLDQLEKLQAIRSDDIPAVEKFADLKTIKVIKLQQLQAEGHAKKLGDGILHSLLVT